MARTGRKERRRLRRLDRDGAEATAFDHVAERELADYVGGYLIPEDQQSATTQWHPSRRGNSPHHGG
jgi:hypothetical protein